MVSWKHLDHVFNDCSVLKCQKKCPENKFSVLGTKRYIFKGFGFLGGKRYQFYWVMVSKPLDLRAVESYKK